MNYDIGSTAAALKKSKEGAENGFS